MARHATGVSLLPVLSLIDVGATVGLTDCAVAGAGCDPTGRGRRGGVRGAGRAAWHVGVPRLPGILRHDHDAMDAFQMTLDPRSS